MHQGPVDRVIAKFRALAVSMEKEAVQRHEVTKVDPVADTKLHDARLIIAVADAADEETKLLTVAEYAAQLGGKVTPQTINQWCRDGKIEGAIEKGRGFLIPRNAQPPKMRAGLAARSNLEKAS